MLFSGSECAREGSSFSIQIAPHLIFQCTFIFCERVESMDLILVLTNACDKAINKNCSLFI